MTSPQSKVIQGDISVVGLGKLGAPLAACLAHKGYRVIGVDAIERVVRAVQDGRAPVYEPGLDEMIKANRERLTATMDIEEAVLKTDITFIVVATPSDESGGFSLKYVLPVCEAIGGGIKKKKGRHIVVLTSTVMPGATEQEVMTLLETKSGKVCGKDFGLCYSPEFIALGSVIRDYLNPDFSLIGESDKHSGEALQKLYETVCDNRPEIARMNFVNAELTKLSVNTFVTTKITFSNTLARICERLPGADVDVVSHALGLDSRIGKKYLKGAIGYGGPCFPRDTVAFSTLAKSVGTTAWLAEATDRVNRAQVAILAELIKSKLKQNGTVGILGLSYKPNTDVVEQSQGVLLAQELMKEKVPFLVYDPQANDNAKKILNPHKEFAESAEDCIKKSDLIAIMTPWADFAHIPPQAYERKGARRTLIDCWRIYAPEKYSQYTEYIGLGLHFPPSAKNCSNS